MDKVQDALKKNTSILDPYASMVPIFVDLSAKAGVNPGAILGGIGSLVLLVLLILQGWNILLVTATVLYPALHSIRAIESPDEEDDKEWLTYWMVFGLYNVVETFFGFIFYFIPYWSWIRAGLFMWLIIPQFKGAKTIYNQGLKPILKQNKELIEYYTKMMAQSVSDSAALAKSSAAGAVTDAMKDPSTMMAAANAMNQAQTMAAEAATPAPTDDEPVEARND